jgi:hypothetical protein
MPRELLASLGNSFVCQLNPKLLQSSKSSFGITERQANYSIATQLVRNRTLLASNGRRQPTLRAYLHLVCVSLMGTRAPPTKPLLVAH